MNFEDWYNGKLEKLQESIGYFFDDPTLLRMALLHSSFTHEHGGNDHNERLEFLGDSVLHPSHCFYLGKTAVKELFHGEPHLFVTLFADGRVIDIPLLRTGKECLAAPSTVQSTKMPLSLFGQFSRWGYKAADAVILRYLDFLMFLSSRNLPTRKPSFRFSLREASAFLLEILSLRSFSSTSIS